MADANGSNWARRCGVAAMLALACATAGRDVALANSPATAATPADRRFVVVLAGHAQREAQLASIALARSGNPTLVRAATRVLNDSRTQTGQLDQILSGWGVRPARSDRDFAAAVGQDGPVPGAVYGCHLVGPLDDLSQLRAATPADVPEQWAELSMNAFTDSLTFRTSAGALSPTGDQIATNYEHWQRPMLSTIVPLLPDTDRAYATATARGGPL